MAIVLQYSFTDYESWEPTTRDPNISATKLYDADLSLMEQGDHSYPDPPVMTVAPPNDDTNDAAEAVANDSYFFFSITANSKYKFSLTTLTFKAARGGAATPRGYAVRSSKDDYANNLGTADITTERSTFSDYEVDLSGADFQNQTGTIFFKIYVYSPAAANTIDFDDITLNGTVETIKPAASAPDWYEPPALEKDYRVMKIAGKFLGGSFTQDVVLREIDSSETAT